MFHLSGTCSIDVKKEFGFADRNENKPDYVSVWKHRLIITLK